MLSATQAEVEQHLLENTQKYICFYGNLLRYAIHAGRLEDPRVARVVDYMNQDTTLFGFRCPWNSDLPCAWGRGARAVGSGRYTACGPLSPGAGDHLRQSEFPAGRWFTGKSRLSHAWQNPPIMVPAQFSPVLLSGYSVLPCGSSKSWTRWNHPHVAGSPGLAARPAYRRRNLARGQPLPPAHLAGPARPRRPAPLGHPPGFDHSERSVEPGGFRGGKSPHLPKPRQSERPPLPCHFNNRKEDVVPEG